MGKNMTAEECGTCGELLYYGAKCGTCALDALDQAYEDEEIEKGYQEYLETEVKRLTYWMERMEYESKIATEILIRHNLYDEFTSEYNWKDPGRTHILGGFVHGKAICSDECWCKAGEEE
tara:strand:+ start:310 stop:669 length:360 start_codon:yes stop_codon:yes gene_type:complete